MVPPLSNGFFINAASRFAMPSNNCVTGKRTACCSALSAEAILGASPELAGGSKFAARNEEIRKTTEAVAIATEKIEKAERKVIFMAPILTRVIADSKVLPV